MYVFNWHKLQSLKQMEISQIKVETELVKDIISISNSGTEDFQDVTWIILNKREEIGWEIHA